MPELPDVTVYVERLQAHVVGQPLERLRLKSPFLLRSVDPPLSEFEGACVRDVARLGKRIVIEFPDELFLIIHLMVTGRLRWRDAGIAIPKKMGLAAFDFPNGTLLFTEAGRRKRASLHTARGKTALAQHDPGGIEVSETGIATFREALLVGNHTLKRALSNPRRLSGIGGAYADEICWQARVSPIKLTSRLSPDEIERLWSAARATLEEWTQRLRDDVGDGFPEKVTAFREGMAVHGRYRQPCPACGDPVQRIVYAEHETNYCATCQTGGKLLADRALSQLLKKDWPRTLEEWEALRDK